MTNKKTKSNKKNSKNKKQLNRKKTMKNNKWIIYLICLALVIVMSVIGIILVCKLKPKTENKYLTELVPAELNMSSYMTEYFENTDENEEQIIVETFEIEKFLFPVDSKYRYTISSDQGLRDIIEISGIGGESLSTGQKWHQGLDIACPDQTPVYSDKKGVISTVYPGCFNGTKWNGHPIYGGLIIIDHLDGTISLFAHLSFTGVKEGDTIERGDLIALSGGVKGRRASGQSTGAHLHYAVYLSMENLFDDNINTEN